MNGRTFSFFTSCPNFPAMGFNHFPCNGKSEPCTAILPCPGFIYTVKPLENPVNALSWYSDTLIGYSYFGMIMVVKNLQCDCSLFR